MTIPQDPCVDDLVSAAAPRVIELKRALHRHPELAFDEHVTAALVSTELESLGIPHQTNVGGTGVVARLPGRRPGRTVLLRADLDALPIHEPSDNRALSSEVAGVMHACGHDGHVAVLLGTLGALAALSWPGDVLAVFQPAEETDEGAAAVIASGATAGADVALGFHFDTTLPTGAVAVGSGVQWAHCVQFTVAVTGEPGHAGFGTSVDAVAAAASCVLALERLASTWGSEGHASVTMVEAAAAPNVAPELVILRGTLRTLDPERIVGNRTSVAHALADAAQRRGASVQVAWGAECPTLDCDVHVSGVVERAVTASSQVLELLSGRPSTGCDDFARYLHDAPGCYFRVGAAPDSGPVPHHHPRFELNDAALPVALDVQLRASLLLLLDGGRTA